MATLNSSTIFIASTFLILPYFAIYRTTADGNCLYSSISIHLVKSEKLCHILRSLSVIELALNLSYYSHHLYYENFKALNLNENNLFVKTLSNRSASELNRENRDYCLLQQAKYVSINFTWSPMVMLLVLSSVINRKIRSIYPLVKNSFEVVYNTTISPRVESFSDILDVLWCRTNIYDSNYVHTFQPNHFVPVLVNQSYQTPTKIMKLQWSESAAKSEKQTNSKCGKSGKKTLSKKVQGRCHTCL